MHLFTMHFWQKKIGVHKNGVQKSSPNFARTNFTDFMILFFEKYMWKKRLRAQLALCKFCSSSPPAVHFYPPMSGV